MGPQRLLTALELRQGQRDRGGGDRVGTARGAQHADHIGAADRVAHAAAREPPRLGEGAEHEDVRQIDHARRQVFIGVFDVHVIEQEEGIRSRGGEASDLSEGRHGPSRVVGRHDDDDAGAGLEPPDEPVEREGAVAPRHPDERSARERGTTIEHIETRVGKDHRAVGLDKRPARAVDRLVGARGHDHALGRHAEPCGERRFEFRHLGIAPQQLGVGAGEPGEQCSRRQHALVRVEPQQRGPGSRGTAVRGLGVDARHGSRGGRGGRRHGTICDRVETTTSVPPAAFTAGITWGRASRGTAAFTA